MDVALRGVQLGVASKLAHGFEGGSASHQRRQEVMPERVVSPLGELVTNEKS